MHMVPPEAMSIIFPMPSRLSLTGQLICCSSVTVRNCPYSELPKPKTSPLSENGKVGYKILIEAVNWPRQLVKNCRLKRNSNIKSTPQFQWVWNYQVIAGKGELQLNVISNKNISRKEKQFYFSTIWARKMQFNLKGTISFHFYKIWTAWGLFDFVSKMDVKGSEANKLTKSLSHCETTIKAIYISREFASTG